MIKIEYRREDDCVLGTTTREDGSKQKWLWYPTDELYERFKWHVVKLEPDYAMDS